MGSTRVNLGPTRIIHVFTVRSKSHCPLIHETHLHTCMHATTQTSLRKATEAEDHSRRTTVSGVSSWDVRLKSISTIHKCFRWECTFSTSSPKQLFSKPNTIVTHTDYSQTEHDTIIFFFSVEWFFSSLFFSKKSFSGFIAYTISGSTFSHLTS